MEIDHSSLRENLSSHQLVISSENYAQVCKNGELPLQLYSAKSNYLQDFHHLDHFHPTGSSSNPVFDEKNLCFDPFNHYPYDCSSSNVVDDLYECKPYIYGDQNVGCGQVMDNFQSGECYNFHQRNHIDTMGFGRNSTPLNFQEIRPINFVVPDEVSCITSGNAYIKKVIMNDKNARTLPSLIRTYKGRKKPNVIKGQWTVEEDRLLVQLVEQYGVRKWSHIAQMLPGRIGKQCRERWHNHLRPDIKKDTWSEEEDRVLIETHAEIGNKWAEIAKRLPGRTENSIKNHWNATKRRQYSKRKCRSKYPRCSLLQDYIKSLNLDSNTTRCQRKNPATSSTAINTKMKSADRHAQITELYSNDRLVSEFDFNDDLEFCFNDDVFQEVCSFNSLIDDIPCGPVDDANDRDQRRPNVTVGSVDCQKYSEMQKLQYCSSYVIEGKFEVERPPVDLAAVAATVEFEVKKELDLVEMMTQVNEVSMMK